MPELTEDEARDRAALLHDVRYDILLDLTANPVRSRTEVRFRCRPGTTTFAELSVPRVRALTLNGSPLQPPGNRQDHTRGNDRVPLHDLAAENVLIAEADITKGNGGRGLTSFSDGEVEYVHATSYPVSAHTMFCCFDQPDIGADTTLRLITPAGWVCAGNGSIAARPVPGEAGTWEFTPVPGMIPLEFSFAAGPFSCAVADGPAFVRCRPGLAPPERLAVLARLSSRALDAHAARLGVSFTESKYDVVFTPGLGTYAISNPGLMMVNESLLGRLADPDDDFMAMLASHEAAHQWFGCLVGQRWWNEVWLDEALATYVSYCDDADWTAFGYRSKGEGYRADELPGRHPVAPARLSTAEAFSRQWEIVYVKGAAVIRQLAALVGEQALNAGLHDYLTRFAGGTATTDDLFGCWSRAAGRDLSGWASGWLREEGTPTLRPEITTAPDGTISSLTVLQDLPRTQLIGIGLYDAAGGRLRRRRLVTAEIDGARTEIPSLAGEPAPDAVLLNDGDLAVARTTFDEASFRAIAEVAMDVGDPLAEVVCWNAAWNMVTSAALTAAGFAALVTGRMRVPGLPVAGLEVLLARAVTAADMFAPAADRAAIREAIAAAAQDAERSGQTPPVRRALATGFAAAAQSESQLGMLRARLGEEGTDAELRGEILRTLSARGLATDEDLDKLAEADHLDGAGRRLTCLAMRPDPRAKRRAWTAALDPAADRRTALAHAEGIWVPGQEDLLWAFRERYFREAVPELNARIAGPADGSRAATVLARTLFPVTLADQETLAMTRAVINRDDLEQVLRIVLLEREAVVRSALGTRLKTAGKL